MNVAYEHAFLLEESATGEKTGRLLGAGLWRHCVTWDGSFLCLKSKGGPFLPLRVMVTFYEWVQVQVPCELGSITYLRHRFSNRSIQYHGGEL